MTQEIATVIVPLYKVKLDPLEEISLQQCFKMLSGYKIIAIKPHSLSLSAYNFKFDDVVSFEDEFFKNPAGYNKLMRNASFYEKFLAYKYMLIYQPDVFVFRDDLRYWCEQGYDYIGAPWLREAPYPDLIKKIKNEFRIARHIKQNVKQPGTDLPSDMQFENRVGNGGFSLRNIQKFHIICMEDHQMIDFYNSRPEYHFGEDVYWSLEVNRKSKRLNIPDYKKAAHFSFENSCEHALIITGGKLPFGCHAWDRNLNFWQPILEKEGVVFPSA
ncbi:DUF5672 family protein [Pedobacter cryoconitis]|uniref:DUF5672 domain-containing protein n=1 Tax=Pedobacter cryoconitis TaxID=188932 RepID=A0A327S938_9SPHI|nr:DUF5672 family protein [Pedobacter cryoconitis]RAJ25579.1 hypothetical protein LY11_04083 [Pedobacter cryoconitis]